MNKALERPNQNMTKQWVRKDMLKKQDEKEFREWLAQRPL
jgi:hypothetical protein